MWPDVVRDSPCEVIVQVFKVSRLILHTVVDISAHCLIICYYERWTEKQTHRQWHTDTSKDRQTVKETKTDKTENEKNITEREWETVVLLQCLVELLKGSVIIRIVLGWHCGALMCKLIPFLQGVSVSASVNTLAAISLDRCAFFRLTTTLQLACVYMQCMGFSYLFRWFCPGT